jgi:hypothetical protein
MESTNIKYLVVYLLVTIFPIGGFAQLTMDDFLHQKSLLAAPADLMELDSLALNVYEEDSSSIFNERNKVDLFENSDSLMVGMITWNKIHVQYFLIDKHAGLLHLFSRYNPYLVLNEIVVDEIRIYEMTGALKVRVDPLYFCSKQIQYKAYDCANAMFVECSDSILNPFDYKKVQNYRDKPSYSLLTFSLEEYLKLCVSIYAKPCEGWSNSSVHPTNIHWSERSICNSAREK